MDHMDTCVLTSECQNEVDKHLRNTKICNNCIAKECIVFLTRRKFSGHFTYSLKSLNMNYIR